MRKIFTSLAAAAALAGAAQVASANLILNGDFSANAADYTNDPGYNGGGNPAAPTDWAATVNPTTSGINGPGTYQTTHYGSVFAPLTPGVDNEGNTVGDFSFLEYADTAIAQTLTFDADTQYVLTFDAGTRFGNISGITAGTITYSVYDGSSVVESDSYTTPDDSEFYLVSVTFTTSADAGAGSLTFANGSPSYGDTSVDVSNVVLQPVPEPASLGLLGMAGMGLLRRRRFVG